MIKLSKGSNRANTGWLTVMGLAALLWAAGSGAGRCAADGQTTAPADRVRVVADRLNSNIEANYTEFIGNVKAVQGDFEVQSERLKVYYAESSNKQSGDPSIQRIVANGNVRIRSGERRAVADQAVYTTTTDVIVLTGNDAKVTVGKNWITGYRITHNRRTGRIKVESSEQRQVEAVFHTDPKSEPPDGGDGPLPMPKLAFTPSSAKADTRKNPDPQPATAQHPAADSDTAVRTPPQTPEIEKTPAAAVQAQAAPSAAPTPPPTPPKKPSAPAAAPTGTTAGSPASATDSAAGAADAAPEEALPAPSLRVSAQHIHESDLTDGSPRTTPSAGDAATDDRSPSSTAAGSETTAGTVEPASTPAVGAPAAPEPAAMATPATGDAASKPSAEATVAARLTPGTVRPPSPTRRAPDRTPLSAIVPYRRAVRSQPPPPKGPAPTLSPTLLVIPFQNDSTHREENLTAGLNAALGGALDRSATELRLLLAEGRRFPEAFRSPPRNLAGEVDRFKVAQTGRSKGVNLVLTGRIETVAQQAPLPRLFDTQHNRQRQWVLAVHAELIDTLTAQALFDARFVHRSEPAAPPSEARLPEHLATALKAVAQAIADRVAQDAGNYRWCTYVLDNTPDRIRLAAGRLSGLAPGMHLQLRDSYVTIDTNRQRAFAAGRSTGVLRITAVEDDSAEARLVSGRLERTGGFAVPIDDGP
jgi:lipopolysaccharide export system protein LptA